MTHNDFRSLAENTPDVIVRYDRECRRVYVNPAHERVNGIPATELLGKSPAELASEKTVAGAMALALEDMLRSVIATAKPGAIDLTWKNETGGITCHELRATPEFDENGDVATVLTVGRDVSAQRESTRRLSMLDFALDHAPEAFFVIDENARFAYVNEEACRELGFSRDELLGVDMFAVAPGLTPQAWSDYWRQMNSERALTERSTLRRRNGGTFPIEAKATLFEFEGAFFILLMAQDLTKRLESEQELFQLVQEFRALAENSPDTIARYDRDCRRIYANTTFARITGVPVVELLGKRPSDYQNTIAAQIYEETIQAVFSDGEPRELEYTWPTHDARLVTSQMRLVPEFGVYSEVVSVLVVARDITALKETQRRLQEAEAMAGVGHWQWDFVRGESLVSAEICRIFGHPSSWRPSLDDLLAPVIEEDKAAVYNTVWEGINRRQEDVAFSYRINAGDSVRYLHTIAHVEYGHDNTPSRLVGTTQDISDLKNTELRLLELSQHDLLTGLPNRNLLMERLYQAMGKAVRSNEILGLMVVNLDRFKDINDTHGHNTGDRLLFAFAERLRKQVREHDLVAHLGGDRFALVLSRVRAAADLGTVSRKIIDDLAYPFQIDELELFASICIGVAVFPTDGATTVELLKNADSALNEAKSHGRGNFHFYSQDLSLKSKERVFLEAALRHAEHEGQLELYYQPKIDLRSGRLVGAEALLRWNHPDLGMITPDKFIGIAEDTGLIVGIGIWVLTKACVAVQRWNAGAKRKLRLAVNMSARQFRDNDLAATVLSILSATGCDPNWLELEITESLLLDNDSSVRSSLEALRDMGVTIAIDDFGTGYSALGYLRQFPIDVLKIDRSFINDIGENDFSSELVKAIVSMGHCLGMEIVAEGVETEDQERFLRRHGCQLGQGYRYSRPLPVGDFESLEPMLEIRANQAASKGTARVRRAPAKKQNDGETS